MHTFWTCIVSKELWNGLLKKVSNYFEIEFPLDRVLWLIGNFSKKQTPLYIMSMLVKREIICSKWKQTIPSARKVWLEFLQIARIERLIHLNENRMYRYVEQWGEILALL